MRRGLKNALKSLSGKLFRAGQHLGVDILPRHFYSEIPDIRLLRKKSAWKKPFTMAGVRGAGLDEQVAFLQSIVPNSLITELADKTVYEDACQANGEPGYGYIEAQTLYSFVHTRKPSQIIQVGCGVSTAICLAAAADAGYEPTITCIEPYPTGYLQKLGQAGSINLIPKPVEETDPEFVRCLGKGDLFFVDSTHTLGPSGEVSRLILEFLPRLAAGTFAHFHDIFFPYDYPGNLLDDAVVFPHESPLLHGYLVQNSACKIATSLSMLHHAKPDVLKTCFPRFDPRTHDEGLTVKPGHFPSSTYLEFA